MLTAEHTSFERKSSPPGTELYELIVSPDRESLAADIANGAKADRLTTQMTARGYRADRTRRDDGGRVVIFTKP